MKLASAMENEDHPSNGRCLLINCFSGWTIKCFGGNQDGSALSEWHLISHYLLSHGFMVCLDQTVGTAMHLPKSRPELLTLLGKGTSTLRTKFKTRY